MVAFPDYNTDISQITGYNYYGGKKLSTQTSSIAKHRIFLENVKENLDKTYKYLLCISLFREFGTTSSLSLHFP